MDCLWVIYGLSITIDYILYGLYGLSMDYMDFLWIVYGLSMDIYYLWIRLESIPSGNQTWLAGKSPGNGGS